MVIDAFCVAPVAYFFGYEFAIVGYEDFDRIVSLSGNGFVPDLDGFAGFALSMQRDAPHITGEIIN